MFKLLVFNERWCAGGVEALWANIIAHMPNVECEIVVLVGKKETNIYDDLLSVHNIKLVSMGLENIRNPIVRNIKIMGLIGKYFKEEHPDIIHINVSNAIGLKYAKIGRKCKCKNIFVHAHNTKIEHDPLKIKWLSHILLRIIYGKESICRVACSTEAGQFVFGNRKDFKIIKNGVDLGRFKFNQAIRDTMRAKFGFKKDNFVICHVGRFVEQKNHKYLIELFNYIYKKNNKSRLVLAGDGPEKEKIKDLVKRYNIENAVLFLGAVKEIEKIYCLSDCFILPSLHEGLSIVAIEAQANGLQCFFADTLSKETVVSRQCTFFSLDMPFEKVADMVIKTKLDYTRIDAVAEVSNHGYSIENSAVELFRMYHDALKKERA